MKALEVVRRLGGQVAVQRLETRVRRMPVEQLVQWSESTIPGIGKALGDWTQRGEPTGLEEARMGTAALLTVLEELERRRAAGLI